MEGFATGDKGSSRVRLYRLYSDGFVGSYPGSFVWMDRAEAVKLAQQTPFAPGQTGWGTAWGYPESAIEPLHVHDGLCRSGWAGGRWCPDVREVDELVYRWNSATAPYVPRTDHEHKRQAQIARAIKNRLARLGARITEDENGRLRLA